MTNEEILKKAVEKAGKNGYISPSELTICDWEEYLKLEDWCYMIIFSHEFAKALFGDKFLPHAQYQHHLKEMVLWIEPLKYIEKYLEEHK